MKEALRKQVGGNHYKDFKFQPIGFIHANRLGFLEGCVVKRICRYKAKGGIEDLKKIQHEIELLIALEYPEYRYIQDKPVVGRTGTGGGGTGISNHLGYMLAPTVLSNNKKKVKGVYDE